jgi:hypothetical protein
LCIAIAFFIFCDFFLQLKRRVCYDKVGQARQDMHLWGNGVELPVLLLLNNKRLKAKGSGFRFQSTYRTILNFEPRVSGKEYHEWIS